MYIEQTTIKFPNITNVLSGKNTYVEGQESINICLGLLLRTSKGELLGDPQFGCNLMKYIHEPNDLILQDIAREDIISAIRQYERRIEINPTDINVRSELNKVYITINYRNIKTGSDNTFELIMLRSDAS